MQSLKSLAAAEVLNQVWQFSNQQIETVYFCITANVFNQEHEDDAVYKSLLTLEQIISDPLYAKKLAKDSRTLPFFLSLLKKRGFHEFQIIAYQLLAALAKEDNTIREILTRELQLLTIGAETATVRATSLMVLRLKAFLSLFRTLVEDSVCLEILGKSSTIKLENGKPLIPHLNWLLYRSSSGIITRDDKEERKLYAEIIGQTLAVMKYCSRDPHLLGQVAQNSIPQLSFAATFQRTFNLKISQSIEGDAVEVLLNILTGTKFPRGILDREDFRIFLRVFGLERGDWIFLSIGKTGKNNHY